MKRNYISYIIFSSCTFIMSYCFYVFPIEILLNWAFQTPILSVYSLLFTVISFGFIFYYLRSKSTFFPLRLFVFQGIGLGFFAFLIINIIVTLDIILLLTSQQKLIFFFVSWISLILLSYLSALRLKETKLTHQSKKISKSYQLLFISDAHLGSNSNRHFKKIISKIKQHKANALLIGGDLIDNSSFKLSILDTFKSFTIPIYFVTGNHEYYLKNHQAIIDQLKNYNIQVLNNEITQLDEITIIGLSDNQSPSSQLSQLNSLSNPKNFNITMVHKPSIWPKASKFTDLMLSGHTHNGQLFPFNWLVKLQFPYHYGTYSSKKSLCYVSSGASTWGPKMRFGSFNEIVIINLKPQTPSVEF